MSDRLKALGAGADIVDVSKITAPITGGGVGTSRALTPAEVARSKREAGF